ncbi:FG-GAP-like repeat-containing protein [Bradyrhizobium cytisi]|uniref:VCBS repeat-containing protein n=1 Tax=Bradyrhizobium cytisi TaxID=515489 RepID=A0A5S4WWC0_9BRAD|nr:FG-GAP-like repeat-containing protein [Bradyrhizobium cytisi]TYL85903.1 VCBS repeat-containing protein [Bradyrhizobium cytisi]
MPTRKALALDNTFEDADLDFTGTSTTPLQPSAVNQAPVRSSEAGSSENTETMSFQGSGLVFVNTWGAGASTQFKNIVISAEQYLSQLFPNACTVNCTFDLQSLNPAYSGENFFNPVHVSYASFASAIQQHAHTAAGKAAATVLMNTADPTGGAGLNVSIGEARILGLASAGNGTDDTIYLNNVYWTASALQNYPNDAKAVILHELTEGIMGRVGGLGKSGNSWAPMDFFRYTASGQHDYTGGSDGKSTFFSIDGRSVYTQLQFHASYANGTNDGFDLADWDGVLGDSNNYDPFGPGGPGVGGPGVLSPEDIQIMQALGWGLQTHTPKDLNGDGISDVLFRNNSTGDWGYEALNGTGGGTWHALSLTSAAYSVVGASDFNGDGIADVLYRNNSTGDFGAALFNSSGNATWEPLGGSSIGYSVVGAGDFNGDGVSDILFRNNASGDWGYDALNGSGGGTWHALNLTSPAYNVVGIGDFNGDGVADVLYRNNGTGDFGAALFNHNGNATWEPLGSSSTAYSVVGTGDFNGDGISDVLFRNNTTGDWGYEALNGSGGGTWHVLSTTSATYSVVEVGDFNGDGVADVLFRENSTGNFGAALFGNNGIPTWQPLGGSSAAYSVVGGTNWT